MSDPLSVASGVAGLLCLGAATSKHFYSLFTSAVGAPSFARSLASALFTLNTSFGQVQEALLDPDFVQQSNDRDIDDLEGCLGRCTELFSDMDSRIRRTGLAELSQSGPLRTWESIKMIYKEDELEEALRRITEEKATLALIFDAFGIRMTARMLGNVEHMHALAKKQDRRLKDIHVFCQWATGNFNSSTKTDDIAEYSGFTASQAYTSNDMRNLLHSSGSVLSLQLGDLCNDSVSMVWTPESASTISPRRVKSTLSPKQPTIEDLRHFQKVAVVNLPSDPEIATNGSPLQSLAEIYALAERSSSRRSTRRATGALCGMADVFRFGSIIAGTGAIKFIGPLGMKDFWEAFEKHLVDASTHNQSMIDDLGEIRSVIMAIDTAGGDAEIEEILQDVKEAVFKALSEYMRHAAQVFQSRTSKQVMKELTGEYEKKRKRLVKDIKTAVKVYKFRHQVCTGAISIRQQREMLDLTRKRLELERGQPTVHVDEGLNSQMALEMTSNENSPLLVGRDHLDQCKDQ